MPGMLTATQGVDIVLAGIIPNPNFVVRQLVNGLVFGSMLALMSAGLALSWGVMRVFNFAHDAFFAIGAYGAFLSLSELGLGVFPSALVGMAIMIPVGAGTERFVIKPLRGGRISDIDLELRLIAALLGLSIALKKAMEIVLSAQQRTFPPFFEGVMQIGPFRLSNHRVFLIVGSIALLGSFFAIVKYTRYGMAIRAVSQDASTAEMMGIDTDAVYTMTFTISAILAGIAGILLAPVFNIYPEVGFRPFLLAFIVVIIGGLGSVKGAVYAAFLIGILQSIISIWIDSQWVMVLVFVAMIFVLMYRPSGIAGVIEE
jgi:branched-chain amino acid transport system permease protein